eukprot:TRINITY_DN3205_c0_g1_i1.p1 TRINITY_DN3205_c0_g1~~TRINITY_DN3205_c0_g1_i1.p1  ORF type:complete len:337 (+),score=122.54 TRINITY_DN3205_c0_g1_i1:16-1026(+)
MNMLPLRSLALSFRSMSIASQQEKLATSFVVPKKPATAFNIFVSEKMKAGGKISEQIKIISKEWKSLSGFEKGKYVAKAESSKEKYKVAMMSLTDQQIQEIEQVTVGKRRAKKERKSIKLLEEELKKLQHDKPKSMSAYTYFVKDRFPANAAKATTEIAALGKAWTLLSSYNKEPFEKMARQNKLDRENWEKLVAKDGRLEKIEELKRAIALGGMDALKKNEEREELMAQMKSLKSELAKLKEDKPKVASNGYAYFVKEKIGGTSFSGKTDMKELAKQWNAMSASAKAPYAQRVAQMKLKVKEWEEAAAEAGKLGQINGINEKLKRLQAKMDKLEV